LPPLVKGYLRVGAKVGSGVYVDHMFGVTDIFIILRVADIEARYLEHFTEPLPRAA
jgi:putative hemolysin